MPLFPPQDFRSTEQTHRQGLAADKPNAADVLVGTLYHSTDTNVVERSDGASWITFSGSGAPGPAGGVGPMGPPGIDGTDGIDGIDGVDGSAGAAGIPGSTGPAGAQGSPGIPGLDGQDGEDSLIPGPPGINGVAGATGAAGSPGSIGPPGLDGIDGEDGLSIVGPSGPAGSAGVAGAAGIQGPPGPPGLDAEEPEYPYIIPGPRGATGAAGGGGGGSATTVEVNLAATATWRGSFTITDAAITGTSKVLVWQAPGPYTGKGTRADEAEMQPVSIIAANPGAGSASVYWQTPPMVTEKKNSQMMFLTAGTTVLGSPKDPQAINQGPASRIGKVRGNVKFSYVVFS
jgi:hypothetical protein